MKSTLSVKYQKIMVMVRFATENASIDRGERGDILPIPQVLTICNTKYRAYSNHTYHSKVWYKLTPTMPGW